INDALFSSACKLMLFAIFVTYVSVVGHLNTEAVFVTITIYNAIREPATRLFPGGVGLCGESYVALCRVNDILLLDEKVENSSSITSDNKTGNDVNNAMVRTIAKGQV